MFLIEFLVIISFFLSTEVAVALQINNQHNRLEENYGKYMSTEQFDATHNEHKKKELRNMVLQTPDDIIDSNLSVKESLDCHELIIYVDITDCNKDNLHLELFFARLDNENSQITKSINLWNWGESEYSYKLYSSNEQESFLCSWKININDEFAQLRKGDSFALSCRWLPDNLRYAPPSLRVNYFNSLSPKEMTFGLRPILIEEFTVSSLEGSWTSSLHPIIPADTQILVPMLFTAKEQRSFNKYATYHTNAIQSQLCAYKNYNNKISEKDSSEVSTKIFIDPEDLPPPNDVTAPSMNFIIPSSSGQSIAPSYCVRVWAEDDVSPTESGIKSVTFRTYSNGDYSSYYGASREGTSSYWHYYLPLVSTETYKIYAKATDNAGNIRTISISDIYASPTSDITAPSLSILTDMNSPLKGIIDIQISTTDENGVSDAQLRIDSGYWIAMSQLSENIWQMNWDTSTFLNGEHSMEIQSKDSFGNTKTIYLTIEILNPINFAVFCGVSTFGNGDGVDPPISNGDDGDDCLLYTISHFMNVVEDTDWEVTYLVEGELDELNDQGINGLFPNFYGDLDPSHLLNLLTYVSTKTTSESKLYLHISTHLEAIARVTVASWPLFLPTSWGREYDSYLSASSYGFYFSTSYVDLHEAFPFEYFLFHTGYIAQNVLEVREFGFFLDQLFMSQGVETFFWSFGCRGEKLYELGEYSQFDNIVLWYFQDHSYIYSFDFAEFINFDLPLDAFCNNFNIGSSNVVSTGVSSIFTKVRNAYLALQTFIHGSGGDLLIYSSLSSWEL